MRRTFSMRITAVTLALLLSACASVPRVEVTGVADRLYCGRSINGGGEVTDAEVADFLEEIVEARFPEGFTVWTAEGRWKGGEERTLVIEIVHPYGAEYDRKVEEIAQEYRRRFRQSSVLRVRTPALMQFIGGASP